MSKTVTIKIKVDTQAQAYRLVAKLGIEYDIIEAEYDKKKEVFDKDNKPNQFLKNYGRTNK